HFIVPTFGFFPSAGDACLSVYREMPISNPAEREQEVFGPDTVAVLSRALSKNGWRETHSNAVLIRASNSGHVATTGRLMIALMPGRLRHWICAGSTANLSFGQRVYKASSAHLPSKRAS